MNLKAFFVDALTSALELGIGTPDDVIRHVTPDVLAEHLPRPLWARLFTACLGAPRVDAQLVVETIGVPNLCEHVPSTIIWVCIAEIGARSLGKVADVAAPPAPLVVTASGVARAAVLSPPPEPVAEPAASSAVSTPVAIGPSIPAPTPTPAVDQPLAELITELEADGPPEPRLANLRSRSPTAQRFRQSSTGVSRLSGRRPQAAASSPARSQRESADLEQQTETHVGDTTDWRQKDPAPVEDSQMVDWQSTDGAGTPAVTDDDFSDLGRKR